MINYKFSYIFMNFGIFVMIKLIPFDKIFDFALSEAVKLTEHAISGFLEILSIR